MVRQKFNHILALEAEFKAPPDDGRPSRTPRAILEDLLRERDAVQARLLAAERSMRAGRNQVSGFVYQNARGLLVLILAMSGLAILNAMQIRRYRSDLEIRKQSEEALRISETRFRGLFEHVVEGVYQTTLSGKILAANPALYKMLGFDSEEEIKAAGMALIRR